MKIKAIIASLVLGSSSLAMASPAVTVVRDHRPVAADDCAPDAPVQPVYSQPVYSQPVYSQPVYSQPVYSQPVYSQPVYSQPVYSQPVAWHQPAYRPVTLATGLRFANQGRAFITVGNQAGRFGSLQISAAGGRTLIKDVVVQFADGQRQIVRNLDRTLVGSESLNLDLEGGRRAIRQITVTGTDLNNGRRRNLGSFTVTAA